MNRERLVRLQLWQSTPLRTTLRPRRRPYWLSRFVPLLVPAWRLVAESATIGSICPSLSLRPAILTSFNSSSPHLFSSKIIFCIIKSSLCVKSIGSSGFDVDIGLNRRRLPNSDTTRIKPLLAWSIRHWTTVAACTFVRPVHFCSTSSLTYPDRSWFLAPPLSFQVCWHPTWRWPVLCPLTRPPYLPPFTRPKFLTPWPVAYHPVSSTFRLVNFLALFKWLSIWYQFSILKSHSIYSIFLDSILYYHENKQIDIYIFISFVILTERYDMRCNHSMLLDILCQFLMWYMNHFKNRRYSFNQIFECNLLQTVNWIHRRK